VADFQVKLARYDAELKHFIHHPLGLEYFTRHLEQEFSTENINFWKDVQRYKTIPNQEERVTEAERIINTYLLLSSPQEINIKGNMKEATVKRIRDGDYSNESFADATNEVLKMMERDSFKRFKQSTLFQDFLEAADTYQVDNRRRRTIQGSVHKKNSVGDIHSPAGASPAGPGGRSSQLLQLAIKLAEEKKDDTADNEPISEMDEKENDETLPIPIATQL